MSGLLHLGIMGNDPLHQVGEVRRMSCTDLALEQQHRPDQNRHLPHLLERLVAAAQ